MGAAANEAEPDASDAMAVRRIHISEAATMTNDRVESYMRQHGRFTYRGMLQAQRAAYAFEADTYVGRLVDDHLLRTDRYDPKEEIKVPCNVQVVARGPHPCLTATQAEVTECCQRDADAEEAREPSRGR